MPLLYSIFPMLLLLHLLLHLPALLASSSSFSLSHPNLNHQLTPIPTTQIHLGRRTLLSNKIVVQDDEDEEAPPLPKKKKPPKLDDDSLALLKSNKMKSSSGQDNQVSSSSNNKKSSHDDQGSLKKKNKSSPSDDEGEEESLQNKEKKKKSSADDEGESIKKKKSSASLDDGKQGSVKKKKSLSSSFDEDEQVSLKKKKSAHLIKTKPSSAKNQSSSSSTTQNKSREGSTSSKNKNKLTKTSKDEEDDSTQSSNWASVTKTKLKKLDSTKASSKSGSTKSSSTSTSKSSESSGKMSTKSKVPPSPARWMYGDNSEDNDFISEFRDMPAKFQQTIIPDLHRISTTSKMYLTKANKEMTKGFKPYVGVKYAPSAATGISVAFILLPLLMVSLVFNKIKPYFSLQRLLIFIQIYLSIYFSILCFSSLLTGLEPLKFFYATSQSTYIWLQVLQTLGYVLYLLLLLMYLILVFSTETLLAQKFLGLAQTIVGFAVGLHYYMTVFHRVVLRQPPKTNWKVHAIYATSFLLISLFATADTRKKAYLQEGGEQGKNS